MLDTDISRLALGGALILIAALAVAGSALRFAPEEAARPASSAEQSEAAQADTIEIPSIEKIRQRIVGTWIQDRSVKDRSIDAPKKGPMKWVFTEDGTLKKYRRSDGGNYQLDRTVQYALVRKNPETGQKLSDNAGGPIAYLKTTESDGEVEYSPVANINRSADPPFLYLQFTGATITSVHFSPPSAFN
mgnify:CR=1 FL=1|jgi:hypothetical protein